MAGLLFIFFSPFYVTDRRLNECVSALFASFLYKIGTSAIVKAIFNGVFCRPGSAQEKEQHTISSYSSDNVFLL